MIRVCCPGCGRKLGLPDRLAGKPVRCPACQAAFAAPAPETEASHPPEAVRAAAPGPAASPAEDVLEEVPAEENVLDAELVEDALDAELVEEEDDLEVIPGRRGRRRNTGFRTPRYHYKPERSRRASQALTVAAVIAVGLLVLCVGSSLVRATAGIPLLAVVVVVAAMIVGLPLALMVIWLFVDR